MKRQNQFSPVSPCCHCNSQETDHFDFNKNNDHPRSHNAMRDEYERTRSSRRQEAVYCSEEQLDEKTRQKFTNMRQKACKFISEELECSSSSYSDTKQGCTCPGRNAERELGTLQREADSIDYIPQSEFLKKIKRQLQCHCDGNQKETLSNSNEVIPKVCEECITKSNEIIKLLRRLHEHGQSATTQHNQQCRSCHCPKEREQDRSGINRIVKTCRSVVDELKNVLNGECFNENDISLTRNESNNEEDYFSSRETRSPTSPKNKSQHVSRTKKRVKCRGRRKRKSEECKKYQSQEQFEPSLKKPLENSCERCWRYASPSRSPVNKPAQRFDPNFRKAHSCQDFLSATEAGESEADRSIVETPDKIQLPLNKRNAAGLMQCKPPNSIYGSTKVKELMMENSDFQSVRSQYQKKLSDQQESSGRKPRPKSCTPGASSSRKENRSSLDVGKLFEYKDIKFKRPYTPRNGNSWTNDDGNPRSSCLKEGHHYANDNMKSYDGSRMKFGRECTQDSILLNLKRNYNPNTTNASSARDLDQMEPNFMPSFSACCRECTCFKTSQTVSNSTRYAAQSLKKSPGPGEYFPSVRTRSSNFTEDKCRSSSEKRPQTGDRDVVSSYPVSGRKERQQVESPVSTKTNLKDRKEFGEFRCCSCQIQSPKPVMANPFSEDMNSSFGKPKCCYCRSRRDSSERQRQNRNSPLSQVQAQRQSDANDDSVRGRGRLNCYDQRDVFESDIHLGNRVPCPHRSEPNENPESFGGGKERCSSGGGGGGRGNENSFRTGTGNRKNPCFSKNQNFSNNSYDPPKKYCVFYMTKSKNEKGNEVEVLVEELTERGNAGNQDSKMSALKDKMRRLNDCPADSMALRFQKGINESSKNNRFEPTRILYF